MTCRMVYRTGPSSTSLAVVLGIILVATSVRAQQASPQPTDAKSLQDLSKDTKNPFLDSIKLPIQYTSGFAIGSQHRVGANLNIEPLVPFSLNADWNLIARPNLNISYESGPQHQFGLQDLQSSFFLTPSKGQTWIWGVGPVFQVPSATSKALGTGRWSAGPTAALVYEQGPWFAGILTYQLMSFAGDRGRGSINQTYIEPQVSYNFTSGSYIQCDPAMTYDWTADENDAWDIPMGIDVGQAFQLEEHALSFQVGGYDYLKYPDGTPQWIVRAQLTVLFSR